MRNYRINSKDRIKLSLLSCITELDGKIRTIRSPLKKYKISVKSLYLPEHNVQTVGRLNNNIKFEVRSNENHHNVAHFHITIRGKGEGSYRIDSLEPIESNIDSKTEKLVLEWAIKHRDILVSTWNEFHGYRITVS